MDPPSELRQPDGVAVVLRQPDQVLRPQPHRGRVVVGMDADQAGRVQKGPVQQERHPPLPVVQQAQGSDSAGDQPQDVPQLVRRGKGQGAGLLVPADKVDEYTSLADFAGKKVGFQSGTVQEQNVLTQLPDSEPVTFDIIQNAVLALDSGKVDAVSVSIANGEMFVSTNPKLAVSTVQFDNSQNGNVIGFPKGETELVDAVNKIIDEVLEQGLYDQWLEEATAEAENLGL